MKTAILSFLFTALYHLALGQKGSESKAIKLAEAFMRCNGFTDQSIDTSAQKLSYTLNDQMEMQMGRFDFDTLIHRRHNSVYPDAKYITYSEIKKGWMVGFVSTNFQLSSLDTLNKESSLPGLTVIIHDDGIAELSHLNPIMRFLKKLP